jgi:hypothetical protein
MARSTAEKLLIKPATSVWISDPARMPVVGVLPDDVRLVGDPGEATTALAFVDSADSARQLLETHGDAFRSPKALWIAYPKGGRADINRDSLWPIVAEYGLRPISQVALDETWSALRFRPLREGEAPMPGARPDPA